LAVQLAAVGEVVEQTQVGVEGVVGRTLAETGKGVVRILHEQSCFPIAISEQGCPLLGLES